ncbi:hypothetical protein [Aeoliella mucimassa]|uniref:Uncharacterized protein n=1 Tax=Aeoliella mucimassa TaxID=2527972 RepID=A0A518AGN6_9BACT|nr:hypothetical protein [Aeoliella mucimassa]QDU53877.1 hypothetical protein Pan181_00550 [Aeoliella mucimassa]
MTSAPFQPDDACLAKLQEVVGYLNFSSGTHDPKFFANLNEVFRAVEQHTGASNETVPELLAAIANRAEGLHAEGGAFGDISQVRQVLQVLAHQFLDDYRQFHRDLLRHRTDAELWRPLLLARVFETVLRFTTLEVETEIDDVVAAARDSLDNYIGYRPVPVLETQKIEPYRHEWICPIPLYVEGAGVSAGPFEEVVQQTLEILRNTPPDLLSDAWFQLEHLEELALDPRAYDFDHPVNKRPNYHFGQWDPNRIDNKGYYRRFILQPLMVSSLLTRVRGAEALDRDPDQLMFEAAAVLAGTILMASGTSGNGPGCHGSDVTLGTLLPHIADYRDRFYEQLLAQTKGPHGDWLRNEAERTRQPFGGARQHLNHELARRRAVQQQRVHLAQVYARMGYPDAALEQAQSVRVASARMLCQIYCRLTAGHHAIDRRRLEQVVTYLDETTDLLNRGIECGALVDPWSILGFGANFSLFPSIEDTVRDYRVDDLIQLVEQTLDLCSRAWAEAAAIDRADLEEKFSKQLTKLADWWDTFGSTQVGGVKSLDAKEIEVSTNLVAGALNTWHKAGAAAGDVGFWGMFVETFDTSKAFQLVIEALLDKGDLVASMALMMQWLSQVDYTPLEDGDASLHPLALRWMQMLSARCQESGDDQWPFLARFFGQLEASAEEYWHVPEFELGKSFNRFAGPDDSIFDDDEEAYEEGEEYGDESELEDDDVDNLFQAAYDEVTYRDSTDDGLDSAIFDPDADASDYELEDEANRLRERLALLTTVAKLWKHTAIGWDASAPERREQFDVWQREAVVKYGQLVDLLEEVHQHRVPPPTMSHESMVEYDRRRMILESLIEQIITTCVEMSDAGRLLRAAAGVSHASEVAPSSAIARTIEILRSILSGDAAGVRQHWEHFAKSLVAQELLYVPLSKGGSPSRIVKARALHGLIRALLGWLPRLGLVRETCELLDIAQRMETEHPVGPGAITEYDTLFEQGYQALVECVVASAEQWDGNSSPNDLMLVEALQDLTESQLGRWLRHSKTVRLSVVEKLGSREDWAQFVDFVHRYGRDLFTQRFLSLGNLRSILHQGVNTWLSNQQLEPDDDHSLLVDELGTRIQRDQAIELLTIAIDTVVENFREYRDYNATTTQSDHGEMFYSFVDFLRLRASYDRSAWNMKPVFLAHEILIRQGRDSAAEMWRLDIAAQTADRADHYLQAFAALCDKYGMRLPTVAERLGERFIRSLTVDRLRVLVAPAIKAIDNEQDTGAFAALETEIANLVTEPSGSGLDIPDWVAAIEEEVTKVRRTRHHHPPEVSLRSRIHQVTLPWEDLQTQLRSK